MITKDNITSYCNCFKQEVLNYTYKQSNILKLDDENFKTFDNCYYSSKTNKEKYGIEKSPLDNIEIIKNIAIEFCKNIKCENQKNLLFTGNTGLGKTFLSNCIAKEVIDKGLNVVYQTSPILMDQILDYKFSYDKTEAQKEEEHLFAVEYPNTNGDGSYRRFISVPYRKFWNYYKHIKHKRCGNYQLKNRKKIRRIF